MILDVARLKESKMPKQQSFTSDNPKLKSSDSYKIDTTKTLSPNPKFPDAKGVGVAGKLVGTAMKGVANIAFVPAAKANAYLANKAQGHMSQEMGEKLFGPNPPAGVKKEQALAASIPSYKKGGMVKKGKC